MAMKTVNEQVHDELIRYNYALEKVGNGISVKINKELARTDKKLQELIAKQTNLESMGKLTKGYAAELKRLDKSIEAIRAPGFASAKQAALEDFNKLVQVEHDVLRGAIDKALPFDVELEQVKPFVLRNIVALGNFSGGSFDDWFHNWQAGDLKRIKSIVRSDLAQGKTMGDIERHLFGTRQQGYKNGALQVSRNVGTRLARTITNGTSNQSHMEFFSANADVLDGVVFSAVRDGRVSAICNSLHGKFFPFDKTDKKDYNESQRSGDVSKNKYTDTKQAFKKISYAGIDKDYAKEIDGRFLDLQNKYPINKGNIAINTRKSKTYVGRNSAGLVNKNNVITFEQGITLNKECMKDAKNADTRMSLIYKKNGSKLDKVVNSGITVVDHEYAHAIDMEYLLLKKPALKKYAEKLKNGIAVSNIDRSEHNNFWASLNDGIKGNRLSVEIYAKMQKELNLSTGAWYDKVRSELGKYATTDKKEFLAEGFANIRHLKEIEKTPFIQRFEVLFNEKFDEVIRNASN